MDVPVDVALLVIERRDLPGRASGSGREAGHQDDNGQVQAPAGVAQGNAEGLPHDGQGLVADALQAFVAGAGHGFGK